MDDLNSSGSHMVTVLRCKKMAGESTGPTHETSDEEVQEALAAMALPEEKKAAVEELFAIWDYKSIGKIAYKEINSAGLQGERSARAGARGPVASTPEEEERLSRRQTAPALASSPRSLFRGFCFR